ncbi:MAG: transporter associated domain-containing protein, partial [Planctomycetota bacterium]|nr:transporter associated domain-containing protein [Planctomycetota bacterium]
WAQVDQGAFAASVPFLALGGIVFLAEIVPKSVALGMAGPLSTVMAPWLRVWVRLLTPVRAPFGWLVGLLASRVGGLARVSHQLSRDELEEIVRRHPSRFGLGPRAAHAVGEIFGLTSIQVREVMAPFIDLEPIDPSASVAEALTRMSARGERWLLVGDASRAMSHVDAKDLLVAEDDERLGDIGHELSIIPELARLPHLLGLFRNAHADRVLVVDEYGVQAGVVGREDLTEAIVGGLVRSEHEDDGASVRLRPNRGWEVKGQLGVHEFEDLFSVRLPIHRNRTIGGLIVEQLGSMPVRGHRVSVAGLELEVLGVSRGRIHRVLVEFPVEGQQ